jgi:4a-hydroxytetrahydrobiopterin dehydratase
MKIKPPPGWSYRGKAISKEIRCKDFLSAVRLIGKIAKLAERMDHHPDLHLTRYKRLRIALTTHDAGGVTAKDVRQARLISKMV